MAILYRPSFNIHFVLVTCVALLSDCSHLINLLTFKSQMSFLNIKFIIVWDCHIFSVIYDDITLLMCHDLSSIKVV